MLPFVVSLMLLLPGVQGDSLTGLTCDFATSFCYWQMESGTDRLGRDLSWRITSSNFASERYRQFAETSLRQTASSADLLTTVLTSVLTRTSGTNSYCLKFWYRIESRSNAQLMVTKSQSSRNSDSFDDRSPIFNSQSISGANNGEWKEASIGFQHTDSFKMQISGKSSSDGAIRLAAFDVTTGSCYQAVGDTYRAANSNNSRALLSTTIWPNAIIPYQTVGSFTNGDRSAISHAVNEINQLTCVRLRPRQNRDTDYVSFTRVNGNTCKATLGYLGGDHPAELGNDCLNNEGEMMHLMMHILGFEHEHQRSDRNSYVQINNGNVQSEGYDQMGIDYSGLRLGTYDYSSITHFGPYAYAINKNIQTIRALTNTRESRVMGQRWGLSFADIEGINQAYGCQNSVDKRCNKVNCRNGGQCGGPNFCVCPEGFEGQSCETSTSGGGGGTSIV